MADQLFFLFVATSSWVGFRISGSGLWLPTPMLLRVDHSFLHLTQILSSVQHVQLIFNEYAGSSVAKGGGGPEKYAK